jgi:hypothetical protein
VYVVYLLPVTRRCCFCCSVPRSLPFSGIAISERERERERERSAPRLSAIRRTSSIFQLPGREGKQADSQGNDIISSSVKVRDHCIIVLPRINFRQHNVCCNALVVVVVVVPAIVNKEALFFGIILACIKGLLLLPCIDFTHFRFNNLDISCFNALVVVLPPAILNLEALLSWHSISRHQSSYQCFTV